MVELLHVLFTIFQADGLGDGMNCGTSVKTRYVLPALELVKAEDFYGNSGIYFILLYFAVFSFPFNKIMNNSFITALELQEISTLKNKIIFIIK